MGHPRFDLADQETSNLHALRGMQGRDCSVGRVSHQNARCSTDMSLIPWFRKEFFYRSIFSAGYLGGGGGAQISTQSQN